MVVQHWSVLSISLIYTTRHWLNFTYLNTNFHRWRVWKKKKNRTKEFTDDHPKAIGDSNRERNYKTQQRLEGITGTWLLSCNTVQKKPSRICSQVCKIAALHSTPSHGLTTQCPEGWCRRTIILNNDCQLCPVSLVSEESRLI